MQFTIELTEDQAWAFAHYLKRIGYSDYRARAASDAEAWRMHDAGDALRIALAEAGVNPR